MGVELIAQPFPADPEDFAVFRLEKIADPAPFGGGAEGAIVIDLANTVDASDLILVRVVLGDHADACAFVWNRGHEGIRVLGSGMGGNGSVGAFEVGFEFRRAADHPFLERRDGLGEGKGDIVAEAEALEAIEREEKFQGFAGELGLEPVPSDVVRELAVLPADPSMDIACGILRAERGVVRVNADDGVGFAANVVVAVEHRNGLDAVAGAERTD